MRKFLLLCTVGIFGLILSSCLTVEKKQYTFEFTGKNAGKLTIKYINIMSVVDSAGVTEVEDFNDLVDNYLNGDKISTSYPEAKNITKRLFEENGVLCAEVIMDFPDLTAARLYQLDKKSPFMFLASSVDGETYVESNGTYGGDIMPVVIFQNKLKTLNVTTSVTTGNDENNVSLLGEFKKWKKD
jgi:hypothetical protein